MNTKSKYKGAEMSSQVRAFEITQPPSDQGSIVVNCHEDLHLRARRDKRTIYPGMDIDDADRGTYLVAQNELVFCDSDDVRIPRSMGSASVGPWIWSSFNMIPQDTVPVFLGVADHTSKNFDPSVSISKSVIPVCTGGLRAILNNGNEHVLPGDLIMWDYPQSVVNEGKRVSFLRYRVGPKSKLTARIIPLKASGNASCDISQICSKEDRFLGTQAQRCKIEIQIVMGLIQYVATNPVAPRVLGNFETGCIDALEVYNNELSHYVTNEDVGDATRSICLCLTRAISNYQRTCLERIIGKATNAAGPGQVIHVLLK